MRASSYGKLENCDLCGESFAIRYTRFTGKQFLCMKCDNPEELVARKAYIEFDRKWKKGEFTED